MKKLIALMIALMMAMAGMSFAGAEDAAAIPAAGSSSGSISMAVQLNEEAVAAITGGADESAAKVVGAIVGLVNSLGITMTSDGKDAEMIVNVKDQPIVGVGVLQGEDGKLLVSDLFPSFAFKLDQSMMNGTMGGSMPQISIDPEQMAGLAAPVTKLIEALQAKIGEPETVEETFYDTVFTTKMPVNLTTKEALLMVLEAAKELVSQEGFASLLDQVKNYGMNFEISAEKIDAKIEEIKNKPDEDLPKLEMAYYSNEAGAVLAVVNLAKDEETIGIAFGTLASGSVVEVNVPGKAYFIMQSDNANGTAAMNLQFAPQEGMLVNIDGTFAGSEEGFSAVFQVKLNNTELGTIVIEGKPNGVLTGGWSAEGKTVLAFQDMQDQTNENAQAFMTEIQTQAMTLMVKIMQVYPDFAELMSSMTPQTQPQQ